MEDPAQQDQVADQGGAVEMGQPAQDAVPRQEQAMDPTAGYVIGPDGNVYQQTVEYEAHSAEMLQGQGGDMGQIDPTAHWQQQGKPWNALVSLKVKARLESNCTREQLKCSPRARPFASRYAA